MPKKTSVTKAVVQHMVNCHKNNQTVSYSELSAILGEDAITTGRNRISSALAILKKQYGMFFQNIHAYGYQPVPQDKVGGWINERGSRKTLRQADVWNHNLDQVVIEPNDVKTQMRVAIGKAVIENVRIIAAEKTIKDLEDGKSVSISSIKFQLPDEIV